MPRRNQKRRQSRLGGPLKPTDARRKLHMPGEATTPEAAAKLLATKGVKLVTTDRVNGGLRYNIVQRGRARTIRVEVPA